MIIFDLDGTLVDCEHRRHLINPEYYEDLCHKANYKTVNGEDFVFDGDISWRSVSDSSYDDVTHWMPLSQPP